MRAGNQDARILTRAVQPNRGDHRLVQHVYTHVHNPSIVLPIYTRHILNTIDIDTYK